MSYSAFHNAVNKEALVSANSATPRRHTRPAISIHTPNAFESEWHTAAIEASPSFARAVATGSVILNIEGKFFLQDHLRQPIAVDECDRDLTLVSTFIDSCL